MKPVTRFYFAFAYYYGSRTPVAIGGA